MLIIEDHRATAELWRDVLACAGAQAWVAGTIAEATRALDAFDLELHAVVLDYSLPDGNGSEILLSLAGRCAAPGLVVATGLPPDEASAIAARFRADCLIIKPVTAHELVRSVAIAVTIASGRETATHESAAEDLAAGKRCSFVLRLLVGARWVSACGLRWSKKRGASTVFHKLRLPSAPG